MKFKRSTHNPQNPDIVTGIGSGRKISVPTRIPKPVFVIAAAVLLVVIGSLTALKVRQNNTKDTNAVCTSNKALMSKAAKAITDTNVAELRGVVDKVKALENYDKDPNCLNILATYYINTSNYTDAKDAMAKLALVYDQQKGFSKDLGPKAYNMITLQQNVDVLKQTNENISKNINVRGFGQPD